MSELLLPAAYAMAPGPDELITSWVEHHGSKPEEYVALAGLLGVLRRPKSEVKAVLSIDLCEVVRETGSACLRFLGHQDENGNPWSESTNEYARGGHSDDEINYAVRKLMNEGSVPLSPDALATGRFLRLARRQLGVYVVANTSAIEGAELATIGASGLGHKTLRGGFDGILFPRGHDGRGRLTKAEALIEGLSAIGLDSRTVKVAHVDDTVHHHQAFEARRDAFASLTLTAPTHEGNARLEMPARRYEQPHLAVEAALYDLTSTGAAA
jgi:hypothetical protein